MADDGSDEDFARVLMTVHRADLTAYVRRLLRGDHSRTDDVVQETFLKAWQHRHRIDRTALRPWLFRVAHNQAMDHWRRQPPQGIQSLEAQSLESADPRVDDDFERVLQDRVAVAMLSDLSPKHREVLVHLYYMDRSPTQTARALRVAAGTVKSRAHYAIDRLRELNPNAQPAR